MDLNTVKDAFDRVVKKQKLSSSKQEEVVTLVQREIESVLVKLEVDDDHGSSDNGPDPKPMLTELRDAISSICPSAENQQQGGDLNGAMRKYVRALEKALTPDVMGAYRDVEFERQTVDRIVADHFYQSGSIEMGDVLVGECGADAALTLRKQFVEMHGILEAMREGDLEPALDWVRLNRGGLDQAGSDLEMRLHRIRFVEILRAGGGCREEALKYAREHLSGFAGRHMEEIQKLMACLLWAGRLESSPYAAEMAADPGQAERLWSGLVRELCGLMGRSAVSPLRRVVDAGGEGLPTLLKLASVMAGKKQEWDVMRHLPVPVELGREFQFHSVFVCPVSREQGSDDNPPMLMPCGHVLCRQSIMKLSKSSTRTFKCPYCPLESTVSQCRKLFF